MVDFPFFFCYNKFNKGGDKVNERFFQFAREASLKSDYTRRGSAPRIGAIAIYKGSIVAEAWNTDKTSHLQARYNEYRYYNPTLPEKSHAETVLVQRLRWKSLDWSRVQIYLYRELKNGKLAMPFLLSFAARFGSAQSFLHHGKWVRGRAHTISIFRYQNLLS